MNLYSKRHSSLDLTHLSIRPFSSVELKLGHRQRVEGSVKKKSWPQGHCLVNRADSSWAQKLLPHISEDLEENLVELLLFCDHVGLSAYSRPKS